MTRSQRSNLIQWALFVAGLALVALVLGVTVRWGDLADRFFKWEDFTDQFPGIVTEAARNTLVYTAIGYLGGLVIGLVVALMRQSQVPPARVIASVYIEVFRALPALLTILIVGFGLPIAFGAENLPGFLAQPHFQKLDVADHNGKDIVEVVCDPTGELADRFHLLRLERSQELLTAVLNPLLV